MDRVFTTDNTEGYSEADLERLNAAYQAHMAEVDPEMRENKTYQDWVMELHLAAFDGDNLI